MTFHLPCFKAFSSEGLNIMNKLLEKEPVMRMTSPNAIKDPFFKTEGYNDMERNDRIDLDK